MKKLSDILEQLETDLSTEMPDLLYAEDLSDFDTYCIGPSRNTEEKALFIYKDDLSKDAYENRLSLIFSAQLFGVQILEATEYEEILVDYLINYEASEIGMDYIDSLNSDTWPMDENRSTFISIQVVFVQKLDSCDEEG